MKGLLVTTQATHVVPISTGKWIAFRRYSNKYFDKEDDAFSYIKEPSKSIYVQLSHNIRRTRS